MTKFRLTTDRGLTENLSVMLTIPVVEEVGSKEPTLRGKIWAGGGIEDAQCDRLESRSNYPTSSLTLRTNAPVGRGKSCRVQISTQPTILEHRISKKGTLGACLSLCSSLLLSLFIVLAFSCSTVGFCEGQVPEHFKGGEVYKITAYCNCKNCTDKTPQDKGYGITASGYKAREGYVACNWLPFGTQLEIEGLGTYKVMDRGAVSLFGSKDNHIKHLDIWISSHSEAQKFGVKFLQVNLKKGVKNGKGTEISNSSRS